MKKFALSSIFFILFFCFSSCNCSKCQDDDDLRTTPITNNPHIVPNTASSIPGVPVAPPPGVR